MNKYIGFLAFAIAGYFFNSGIVYVLLWLFGIKSFGLACAIMAVLFFVVFIGGAVYGFIKGTLTWYFKP